MAALLALALALLAGGTVWQLAFKTPAVDPAPLPGHLVSLTGTEGQRLLAEATGADYQPLAASFESQRRPAFCGVASSVAVLNALRPSDRHLTQATFFTEWTTELRVTFAGMSLHELGELLRRHGVQADIVYAGDTTLDAFRLRVSENLGRAGDYVLVNYQRGSLGQREGGHISPLAAYSAATDRFLILDCRATIVTGPCRNDSRGPIEGRVTWHPDEELTWQRLWQPTLKRMKAMSAEAASALLLHSCGSPVSRRMSECSTSVVARGT